MDNRTTAYESRPDQSPPTEPYAHPDLQAEGSDPDAPPATSAERRPPSRTAREIIETVLLALAIFVAVRALVLNFKVDGSSMQPNLINNEMLLVNRNVYFHFDLNDVRNLLPGEDTEEEDIVFPFHPPERGDIVVFNPPSTVSTNKPYIKRVIGLAGDVVEIRNGSVFVNGTRMEEPYIAERITDCARASLCSRVTVPEGEIYVLGDNRGDSTDSRVFGTVPIDNVIGKAWITYWPREEFDIVPHYDYPELSG